MKIKWYIIYIIIICSTNVIMAQTAPKYSNEFLNIGVGARALGMSGAVVASTNDVTATYWNPSCINTLDKDMEIGLMHAEYFAGVAGYDFGSVIYRPDSTSVIGANLIRFAVDDIPNTLDLIDSDGNIRWDRLSSFSASDVAVLLTYARHTNIDNLDVGGNIKIIRRKAGDFGGAWGFGVDFSATYHLENWHIAAMAKDVTSTFNAWTFNHELLEDTWYQTGNYLPESSLEITLPSLTMAFAREIPVVNKFSALAEIDLFTTFDGKRNTLLKTDLISVDPRAGIEFTYDNLAFLRVGTGGFQEIPLENDKTSYSMQLSVGAGFKFRGVSIDYALSNLGNSNNFYSHVISLNFRFDTNKLKASKSSFDG